MDEVLRNTAPLSHWRAREGRVLRTCSRSMKTARGRQQDADVVWAAASDPSRHLLESLASSATALVPVERFRVEQTMVPGREVSPPPSGGGRDGFEVPRFIRVSTRNFHGGSCPP